MGACITVEINWLPSEETANGGWNSRVADSNTSSSEVLSRMRSKLVILWSGSH